MTPRVAFRWTLALLCGLLTLPNLSVRAANDVNTPAVDFASDVRPILAERCLACHGPDEGQRKADLRLDTAEGLQADLGDGIDLIVPGSPDESELIFRVEVDDPTLRMPPAGEWQAGAHGRANRRPPAMGSRRRGVVGTLGLSTPEAAGPSGSLRPLLVS